LPISVEHSEIIKSALCTIEKLYCDNNNIKQRITGILTDIQDIKVQLFEYQFKIDTCENTIALMNSLKQYLSIANDINNPWLSVEFIRDLTNEDDLKDVDNLISNSLSYLKDLEGISNNLIDISLSSWVNKITKLLKSMELKKQAVKQITNIVAFNQDISSYFNLGIQLQFNDKQLTILKSDIIKIRKELETKHSNIPTLIDVIAYKTLLKKLEQFSLTNCWLKIKGDENEVLTLINCMQNHHSLKQDLQNLQEEERQNNITIEANFRTLQKFFNITPLKKDINNDDVSYLQLLINKADDIIQTCDYLDIVKSLENSGVGLFWNEIIKNKISKNDIENTFVKTLYSQILGKTLKQNYKLKNTDSIKDDVSEFKILDKSSIQANIDKFKHNFASKICDKIHQELKILKLLNRKPRKLISDYRNEIISIAGCVVCSPLTICQYFDIEETTATIFDTVIFDEASQICTWDAVSSIIRAKQLIVAGDREQMPPSNYFASSSYLEDEEDESIIEERVGDYESLLDFLNTKLKSLPLVWHYRSKYEQLIAPSNKHVYENKLITFPNSNKSSNPMELCYVENAIWDRGKNEIEARQILNKLKQLYKEGKRSIGVIAINYKQSELIQEIIETDEDLLKWYLEDDNDGLFIKNLENCQGDERDIIIISLTFAKDKNMKLSGTTFRQINSNDSYKKLNVMFTRAREKVYLFSSVNSQDIPDKESKAYSFLREYVKCCETGSIDTLKQNKEYDSFDSGFEENVCHLLRSEGFEVHTQVGCSGYRVDLAILHPANKDRYILGIECDGEQYHKGRTAREKDRLRQEVLENKGWKIHRIWSYDWLVDKKLEIQKIKALTASSFH
jgi:very-short-patch-repair endonuclease